MPTGSRLELLSDIKYILQKAIDDIDNLAENPKAVADYKSGNARALGALVGAVMKRMGGKANPAVINKVLAERISR